MAIDRANKPFFDTLFTQGNQLVNQQMGAGGIGSLFPLAQNLGQQGQGFLDTLGGVGQNLNPFIGPGFTQQQIGVLGRELGQFFNEQLLPGISTAAQGAGQLGGGRQGVAQGLGIERVAEAFQGGVVDILQADLARRQQAAGAQGQLQTSASQVGLSGLNPLFNLGLAPFTAQFAPLQAQANLLRSQPVFREQSSSQQALGAINTGANVLQGLGSFGTGAANLGSIFQPQPVVT